MKEINGVLFYNTRDIARMLNVSERTVANQRKKGTLRWAQVGHEKLTSAPNLEAFLNGTDIESVQARERVAEILAKLK